MAETAEPPPATERARPRFETAPVHRPAGTVRRFLTTHRHFAGLLLGGYAAWVREASEGKGPRPRAFVAHRILAAAARQMVDRELAGLPFPVQLRRRLERLGPTYIKLGQILRYYLGITPETLSRIRKKIS